MHQGLIAAPVANPADARAVIAAGASEIYLGLLYDEWLDDYGDADLLSRRQGRSANVKNRDDLRAIVELARANDVRPMLALNTRYTADQQPLVLRYVDDWVDIGGKTLIVGDLGLLLTVRQRHPRLRLHLSLLAGVFNREAVHFFAARGVRRLILPRHLRLAEIAALTAAVPNLEYESLALNQKCPYIDAFCAFLHGVRIPSGVPAAFDYQAATPCPVAHSLDPDFEGHACDLAWQTPAGAVVPMRRDDHLAPHCAACALADLLAAGVRHFKIAGRGYPTELLVRAVAYLRDALALTAQIADPRQRRQRLQALYADTHRRTCEASRCYYEVRQDDHMP